MRVAGLFLLLTGPLLLSCLGMMVPRPPPHALMAWRKLAKKSATTEDTIVTDDCVQMRNAAGDFTYISPGGDSVCGMFVVGTANQLVTIDISQFEIDCEDGGLLVIIDGWEINEQLFPSASDHPRPVDHRYQAYCGSDRPHGPMIMSQNVALLQFRIPRRGQHFRVRLGYQYNPEPCNVISTTSDGVATLSNFGLARNCSLLFVYPEVVQIVDLDVGQTSEIVAGRTYASDRLRKCAASGRDYVEILGGSGIDTSLMARYLAACGLQPDSKLGETNEILESVKIPYPYTAIRVVSSGLSYNTVTVHYQQLPDEAYYDV